MNEEELKLMNEYIDRFDDCIVTNMMPPEDACRLADIIRECLEKDKPYDNYMKPPPGVMFYDF